MSKQAKDKIKENTQGKKDEAFLTYSRRINRIASEFEPIELSRAIQSWLAERE
jgi:hypothetical protein